MKKSKDYKFNRNSIKYQMTVNLIKKSKNSLKINNNKQNKLIIILEKKQKTFYTKCHHNMNNLNKTSPKLNTTNKMVNKTIN